MPSWMVLVNKVSPDTTPRPLLHPQLITWRRIDRKPSRENKKLPNMSLFHFKYPQNWDKKNKCILKFCLLMKLSIWNIPFLNQWSLLRAWYSLRESKEFMRFSQIFISYTKLNLKLKLISITPINPFSTFLQFQHIRRK